jgi:hypothetical protein
MGRHGAIPHIVGMVTSTGVADRLDKRKSFAAPVTDTGDQNLAQRCIHSTLEAR